MDMQLAVLILGVMVAFLLGIFMAVTRLLEMPLLSHVPLPTWMCSLIPMTVLFMPAGELLGLSGQDASAMGSVLVTLPLFVVLLIGNYVGGRIYNAAIPMTMIEPS